MRCANHLIRLTFTVLLAVLSLSAQAHKASDAYLQLEGGAGTTTLRVDVALRDLDVALDLDQDGDGKLTWREVRTSWPMIESYLRTRVQLEGCAFDSATRTLERRVDGVYAALTLHSQCTPAQPPLIRYGVMADVDPTHRGIARIAWAGQKNMLQVLVPQRAGDTVAETRANTATLASAIPDRKSVV